MKTSLNRTGLRTSGLNPINQLAAVAFVTAGMMLFTSAPARAGTGQDWGAIQLANIGDEPQALGEATLTKVRFIDGIRMGLEEGSSYVLYSGALNVSCHNLTPGATYKTPAGTFKANRRGEGIAKATGVYFEIDAYFTLFSPPVVIEPYWIEVVRVAPDGSEVPILEGFFIPPGSVYVGP